MILQIIPDLKCSFYRPCTGSVVSDFSKSQPDETIKSYFLNGLEQYKKFKKMYSVNTWNDFGTPDKDNEEGFEKYASKLNLRYLKINFHATSFDKIEKDRAAKFVDMLSAIGGTMGLLTGFSIISGVEIVYFAIKIILKIMIKNTRPKDN